jgi:glutamate racemase
MSQEQPINNRPIGIFDSGIGGLSVLKSLQRTLPHESFVYLGDTARVPYGTKSKDTVVKYALQAAKSLAQFNIKMLVIACNTATALALPDVQKAFHIPVIGVIEPSVKLACSITQNKHIGLIATEATVSSGCYERVIKSQIPEAQVTTKSCGLLVSLAEEGFLNHPITEDAFRYYMAPIFDLTSQPDCLILGCTHFVFLYDVIKKVIGDKMKIIDSADSTAQAVKTYLNTHHLENNTNQLGQVTYLVTDHTERFLRMARLFSDNIINNENVKHIDIISF